MGIESSFSCRDESGVVGKAEIVVGAEVENSFAIGLYFSKLRRGDDSFCLIGACFFHGLKFFGE